MNEPPEALIAAGAVELISNPEDAGSIKSVLVTWASVVFSNK